MKRKPSPQHARRPGKFTRQGPSPRPTGQVQPRTSSTASNPDAIPASGPPPAQWGAVADWYDQLVGDEGSEFHQRIILPGIVRMLRPARREQAKQEPGLATEETSLRILDLACGQGVLCRHLAALGHRLVGVDIAEPLVAAARAREAELLSGDGESDEIEEPPVEIPVDAIQYLVADATKLPVGEGPLIERSFDAVAVVLAVQNFTPLSPVWQAAAKLLVPGGALIIVMMHPCFRIPQHSNWYWDPERHIQSRTVDTYLGSLPVEIQTHPGRAAAGHGSASTTHHHRPLQAYINTLGSAGLLIDHLEEWASHKKSQSGVKQKELDRSRKEIPMFMALRARLVAT